MCTSIKALSLKMLIQSIPMVLKHGAKCVEFVYLTIKLTAVNWNSFEVEPVVCRAVHVKLVFTLILKTENS